MLMFNCKSIFTHAPSVPDGALGRPRGQDHSHIDDHDLNFVEWLNSEAGSTVEAVFAGHTHQDHIFYDVVTNKEEPGNIDSPYDLLKPYNPNGISPTSVATIYFTSTSAIPSQGICGAPVYIETNTATKDW